MRFLHAIFVTPFIKNEKEEEIIKLTAQVQTLEEHARWFVYSFFYITFISYTPDTDSTILKLEQSNHDIVTLSVYLL